MSIKDLNLKIKPYLSLAIFILFLLIILGIFYIYKNQTLKTPITISINNRLNESQINTKVMGSKNGTKYYFPWCGALNRIKPENRVEFASVELARARGYSPAQNCKGVE